MNSRSSSLSININANPFLKVMTVGDIKSWVDRKMAVGKSAGRS
ncbi:hypothetical protein [Bradyrhizobium sp. 23AC]